MLLKLKGDKVGYITVSDEFEKKFKELESDEAKEVLLINALKQKGKDVDMEIALMEERMQSFKLMSIKYKQSLNNIMQAEYEMLEPIWEEISKIEPKIKARAEELTKKLYPIKDEVKRIVDMLNSVNKWEMNKLFDIVEIVDRFDERKLDLLKKLIEYQQNTNK